MHILLTAKKLVKVVKYKSKDFFKELKSTNQCFTDSNARNYDNDLNNLSLSFETVGWKNNKNIPTHKIEVVT